MTTKPKIGRWTREEMASMLSRVGATETEVKEITEGVRSEDDFLDCWIYLKRQDRSGVIARQKKKRAEYKARKMKDPAYRLENSTRARLWAALKGKTSSLSRLGFSIDQLRAHLEGRFLPGMTWENYGKWHVDHIRPCASFDLSCEKQFAECWALDNLQPLWASDNMRKGASYAPA